MIDEKLFTHAVTITAAFVANGDIRNAGRCDKDSRAMNQVGDMVATLYAELKSAREHLDSTEP